MLYSKKLAHAKQYNSHFSAPAGARVMVANQIQASGGMWLDLEDYPVIAGPGAGYHCSISQAQA